MTQNTDRQAPTQHLREGRKHGFFMVYKSATKRIRAHFAERPEGLTTSTALAVYAALLELLNDARAEEGPVHRRELAERAGVGLKAASRYQEALEAAGVIRVERRVVEGVNLPNVIHVLDTDEPQGAESSGTDPRVEATPQRGPADPTPSGREDTQLPEEATAGEEEEARASARSLALVSSEPEKRPSPDVRYKGQVVPPAVVEAARGLLDVYNAATERDLGPEKADGKPSPALTQIIGAMRARPDVTPERWQDAIRNTVANPPRWVEGVVQIGHVFGERAAEHALANTGEPVGGSKPHDETDDALEAAMRMGASA